MDTKSLKHRLAAATGYDAHAIDNMMSAFTSTLASAMDSQTSVAIPSFGTFSPVKYDEEIREDLSTKRRMLFPPCIAVEFKPAVSFRKKVLDSYE